MSKYNKINSSYIHTVCLETGSFINELTHKSPSSCLEVFICASNKDQDELQVRCTETISRLF